ncbi:hypothetical protein J8J14_03440 [Roseomonas sp. SSH11]|uniref:VanZ-like domain-containing protein n=1 Tax=Pararoseomonas baculiformis TaxID=2820812 RepID=A0ABS4A9Z0_9PROT|nr:hypothetical protein [Pararoseomonas baculiformis]MBP0443824.1 hypothetical protein [Pararoseomonas baculiformis]
MQVSTEGRRIAWGLHAATMLAVTLWLALMVIPRAIDRERGGDLAALFVIACIGIGLGALWKVAEWGFDQLASGDVTKGKHDTIIDIVMDGLGAAGAPALALRLSRPAPRQAGATPAGPAHIGALRRTQEGEAHVLR